ncbi:MAG TPA: flagellin [Persephonella sp.]|uniref:Flagellin n=1 Tax=Persephonella marina (strain DSM 14350 / EX-H1) TaxID=123214 RepID=C0QRU0_PERMH|nr:MULTISPECIES: flagellin [Persephonella]ACO04551.1 flagellar filament 34.5 kDa core protein (Class B) [Persephonella marina EX-H1]HCB69131.1 flagellin [Persephonella sp.]
MGALRINYNYQADFTLNNLKKTEFSLNKSLERLATGYRINRAADDAAGLYIADQLKTYAVSLEQGTRNAQDGVSIAQIGQGSLTEVYNILNDVKAKVIQASNTLDSNARAQIQQDINSLVDAISKIFSDTEFNGIQLFASTASLATSFNIHYGGRTNQNLQISIGVAVATAGSTGTAASTVQIGASSYSIDVTTSTAANTSVQTVDNLIKAVDDLNAKLGSYQIELEKIISNNETQRINTSEAESRIRNVDMAKEMSAFTKYQILMQSGTAMLAQANQVPQMVLQLLR